MDKTMGQNIFKEFGGEENCREKFPKTYQAICNNGRRRTLLTDSLEAARMMLLGLRYTGEKVKGIQTIEIMTDYVISGRHMSGYMYLTAVAVRKSTGIVLSEERRTVFFDRAGSRNGILLSLGINSQDKQDCKLILKGDIIEDSGITSSQAEFNLADYDIIENEYHIVHPRRRDGHPAADPYINYFFWRTPDYEEFVDYKYLDAHVLMCKSEGTAFAKNHGVREILSAALILENDGNQIEYPNFQSKISIQGLGIGWKEIEDWNCQLSELLKSNTGIVSYTLSVICLLEDKKDTRHSFLVTNQKPISNLPELRFCWGCLMSGTMVETPEGPQAIEEMHIGDLVMTEGAVPAQVRNTWSGVEEGVMIILRFTDGGKVIATENHPFLTEHGILDANEILPGCRLKTMDGGFIQVTETYADFLGPVDVYNLEVDGGIYFANGVASGDFLLQNRYRQRKEREKIDPDWLTDYDSFKELLRKEP